MISKKQLHSFVEKKVPRTIFSEIYGVLLRSNPILWGEDRPENFIMTVLYIILYKWLTGMGDTAVAHTVSQWLKTSSRSIRHNSKKMAHVLSIWGRAQIKLATPQERSALLQQVRFKEPVSQITLWMDSTDFRTAGKQSVCKIGFSF